MITDKSDREQQVYYALRDDLPSLRMMLDQFERILFITGNKSFEASGASDFIIDILGQTPRFVFSKFSTNPSYEDVGNGLALYKDVQPDCIVAVGGGSVIDMAKLVNYYVMTGTYKVESLEQANCLNTLLKVPLIAIPTTAGAGSEATEFAVMYRNSVKHSISHFLLKPDLVILNHELSATMSTYQTACCGFDVLSQAVESYWAVNATLESQCFSTASIKICMKHLESAVLSPTDADRRAMVEAAYLAGKAINISKTTAAHALSYSLTAHYGLPHGHAVAMFLPWIYELNASLPEDEVIAPGGRKLLSSRISEIDALLGCETAQDSVGFLYRLTRCIGLTTDWLNDIDTGNEQVHCRVIREVNRARLGNNPCKLSTHSLEWVVGHIR